MSLVMLTSLMNKCFILKILFRRSNLLRRIIGIPASHYLSPFHLLHHNLSFHLLPYNLSIFLNIKVKLYLPKQ
uniref:Uncharacterized protein n=1 Tax=Rhizophora mucronata TaxID=61149 RepID=A0A2P2QLQ5_RHIMU